MSTPTIPPEYCRLAVKACVVHNGQLLLIQRRPNDVHKPNTWDIPGGRLDWGEDPYEGLRRETKEEVQLEIEITLPVDVHHFTRDDGQRITMLIFLCSPKTTQVRLSEEHQAFQWIPLSAPLDEFPAWLRPVVERLNKVYTLGI